MRVAQTCRFLACLRPAGERRIHADKNRRHVCATRATQPVYFQSSRSCASADGHPETMKITPHPDFPPPLPSPQGRGKRGRGERVRGLGSDFQSSRSELAVRWRALVEFGKCGL